MPLEEVPNEGFQYAPLIATKQIRILRLHPDPTEDAPIQAELETIDLDAGRSYFALSYSWDGAFTGDSRPRRTILLHGHPYTVTDNLYAALRRFRQPERFLSLWCDSLCIDQANIAELSAQVSLMHRVYSRAAVVVTWLGEDSEFRDAETFFAFCCVVERAYWMRELRPYHDPKDDITLELERSFDALQKALPLNRLRLRIQAGKPNPVRKLYLEAAKLNDEAAHKEPIPARQTLFNHLSRMIYIFAHRRFFHRRWILQEVHCAKAITIQCGPWKISWEKIKRACLLWSRYENWSAHAGFDLRPLLRMFSNRESASESSGMRRLLLDMVGYSSYECGDPRDRIYALLNLGEAPALLPDYSLSFVQVYNTVAHEAVESGEACLLMHAAAVQWHGCFSLRCGTENVDERQLPSWTPDWRLFMHATKSPSSSALPAMIEAGMTLAVELQCVGHFLANEHVRIDGEMSEVDGTVISITKDFEYNQYDVSPSDELPMHKRHGQTDGKDFLQSPHIPVLNRTTDALAVNQVKIDACSSHVRGEDIICLNPGDPSISGARSAWIFREADGRKNTFRLIGACLVTEILSDMSVGWRPCPQSRKLRIV